MKAIIPISACMMASMAAAAQTRGGRRGPQQQLVFTLAVRAEGVGRATADEQRGGLGRCRQGARGAGDDGVGADPELDGVRTHHH